MQEQWRRRPAARDRDADVVAALPRRAVAVAGAILPASDARVLRGQAGAAFRARHGGRAGGADPAVAVFRAAGDRGRVGLTAEIALRSRGAVLRGGVAA